MSLKRVVAWSLCAAAVAAPLSAQTSVRADTSVTRTMVSAGYPMLELGVFGAYTMYDEELRTTTEELDNSIGGGVLLATYLNRNWAIEFDFTTSPLSDIEKSDGEQAWSGSIASRLVASLGGGNRFRFLLGGGVVRSNYSAPLTAAFPYQDGLQGLAGFRIGGETVALRVDGVYNYHLFTGDILPNTSNIGIRAGLTFSRPMMYEEVDTRINTVETITRVDTVTVTQQLQGPDAGPSELRQAIFFEFDSDMITDAGRTTLDNTVIPYLRNANVQAIAVGGYADQCGSIAYNDALAYRRARAVADYIASALTNITVSALSAGKREPIEETGAAFPGCQSETNRRAEFFIDITGTGVNP